MSTKSQQCAALSWAFLPSTSLTDSLRTTSHPASSSRGKCPLQVDPCEVLPCTSTLPPLFGTVGVVLAAASEQWATPAGLVWAPSAMSTQGQHSLVTHFSECVPVTKHRVTLLYSKLYSWGFKFRSFSKKLVLKISPFLSSLSRFPRVQHFKTLSSTFILTLKYLKITTC